MESQHKAPLDDSETYAIIGAAMDVHRELGCGYLEAVYRRALEIEFHHRRIAFANEVHIPIRYKAHSLSMGYRADFICFETILVEVKALDALGPIEQAQVLNYLKGARLRRAVLLNFGGTSLQYRRMVLGLPRAEDPRARESSGAGDRREESVEEAWSARPRHVARTEQNERQDEDREKSWKLD